MVLAVWINETSPVLTLFCSYTATCNGWLLNIESTNRTLPNNAVERERARGDYRDKTW
jgi:hypothetical protein